MDKKNLKAKVGMFLCQTLAPTAKRCRIQEPASFANGATLTWSVTSESELTWSIVVGADFAWSFVSWVEFFWTVAAAPESIHSTAEGVESIWSTTGGAVSLWLVAIGDDDGGEGFFRSTLLSAFSYSERRSMNSLSNRWTFLFDAIAGRISSLKSLCFLRPCKDPKE